MYHVVGARSTHAADYKNDAAAFFFMGGGEKKKRTSKSVMICKGVWGEQQRREWERKKQRTREGREETVEAEIAKGSSQSSQRSGPHSQGPLGQSIIEMRLVLQ